MLKLRIIIYNFNTFLRIHYIWFFPLVVFTLFQLIFALFNLTGVLDISKVDHNSILTINLTLAGFLLTGLSIMITVRDKDFIKTLIKMKYWQKIELSVFIGMLFNILSALFALFTLIFRYNNLLIFDLELCSFIIGITYFIIVTVWLKKAFKYI